MSDLSHAYHKRYYSELLPDSPDWIHEQLTEEACQAAARLNDEIGTSSELGDELLAERATFAEFKLKTWEEQRTLRAERDKLLGFYTEIVRELGDDLVLKRIRELTARAESAEHDCRVLAAQLNDVETELVDHKNALAVASRSADEQMRYKREAEAKLAGVHAAVVEACKNAQMKVLVWYPENTRSYIHPNQLAEIYESQTTECMAAIEAVFEPGVLKRLAKNEEAAP